MNQVVDPSQLRVGQVVTFTYIDERTGAPSLLTHRISIASVGAELNLNLGVLSWDTPYRFRLGVVSPQHNATYFGRQSVQVYVVSGISF